MGADFIFSINEIKLTKEEAYKKASDCAFNSRQETIDRLVNECGCYHFSDDTTSSETTSSEVYKYLIECLDNVYNYQSFRDCSYFIIDGTRKFAITGGMSWGDAPTNSYESFNVCETLGLTE